MSRILPFLFVANPQCSRAAPSLDGRSINRASSRRSSGNNTMHHPPPPDERCNCTFSKSFAKSMAMVAATGSSSGAFHLQRYIPQSAIVPFSVRRSRVADESFRVFEFPEKEWSQLRPQPDVVTSSLEPQRTDSGQQHVLPTCSKICSKQFARADTQIKRKLWVYHVCANSSLCLSDAKKSTRNKANMDEHRSQQHVSSADVFLLGKIFFLFLRC